MYDGSDQMDSGELILLSVAQWRSLLSLFLLHSFFLALSLSFSSFSVSCFPRLPLWTFIFILSQSFLLSVLSRLNPNWSLSNSLDTLSSCYPLPAANRKIILLFLTEFNFPNHPEILSQNDHDVMSQEKMVILSECLMVIPNECLPLTRGAYVIAIQNARASNLLGSFGSHAWRLSSIVVHTRKSMWAISDNNSTIILCKLYQIFHLEWKKWP